MENEEEVKHEKEKTVEDPNVNTENNDIQYYKTLKKTVKSIISSNMEVDVQFKN